MDELHWKTINRLLKMNDFIFYGDIKSHDVVKNKNLGSSPTNVEHSDSPIKNTIIYNYLLPYSIIIYLLFNSSPIRIS